MSQEVKPPQEIYLQWYNEDAEHDVVTEDTTCAEHRIHQHDVKYRRVN